MKFKSAEDMGDPVAKYMHRQCDELLRGCPPPQWNGSLDTLSQPDTLISIPVSPRIFRGEGPGGHEGENWPMSPRNPPLSPKGRSPLFEGKPSTDGEHCTP